VLFSNPEIVALLDGSFECAWESVRPVPRVEIDFGDGRKLTRTLNGNIATYFCRADGTVIDVVPGLVAAEDFLRRARLALTAEQMLARSRRPGTELAAYHRAMRELGNAGAEAIGRKVEALKAEHELASRRAGVSKSRVEEPVKQELALALLRARIADRSRDLAKDEVEHPVKTVLEDTAYNQVHRDPKIHELLAGPATVRPADITKAVYRILDVDLDDPYLGLAPYVLGGEPGRH
jgi:hypothetical protein